MNDEQTITIKLDASEAISIVSNALEPGAVLLTKESVDTLWLDLGITQADLRDAGAIFAGERAALSIDYRELLKKYIKHVIVNTGQTCLYGDHFADVSERFTPEQEEVIKDLVQETYDE